VTAACLQLLLPSPPACPPDAKGGDKETEVPDIDNIKRKPRDILCLLLFLIAWLGWIVVAAMAVTDGCPDNCNDPRKLIYGYDSQACMCGKDCTKDGGPNNEGKLRLYIPDPRDPGLRLCVAACPTAFAFDKNISVQSGVYLCPDNICSFGLSAKQQEAGEKLFYLERNRGPLVTLNGKMDNCFTPTANATDCWYPTYPTKDVVFKCIPAPPLNLTDQQKVMLLEAGLPVGGGDFGNALGPLSNPAGEVGVMAAELNRTWWVLVVAFVIALIMGFVFLLLIRFFAVPIVWTSMIGLLIVSILGTIFLWDRAGVIPLTSTLDAQTGANISALAKAAGENVAGEAAADKGLVMTAAVVMSIFTAVYFVLFVVLFKKIMIAVKVVREACKALAAMPLLVVQPLCTMVSLAILYIWTAAITMYFMSAGEFDPSTGRFVYSGGDCSGDLTKSPINYTATAAVLTLTFSANVMVKRGLLSRDAGATWGSASVAGFVSTELPAYPDLFLNHSQLLGTGCSLNPATLVDTYTGNVSRSFSKIYTCVCVCIYAYTYAYMYIHVYLYPPMCIYTYVYTYANMYIHVYDLYPPICMYTYIYI
jgi:preprotein translocase subunit SecG